MHTLFVCALLLYILLFPICLAPSANPVHTGKFPRTTFVKGDGIEKGRGIPLPFSVFLVPFITSQKERPSLFPLEGVPSALRSYLLTWKALLCLRSGALVAHSGDGPGKKLCPKAKADAYYDIPYWHQRHLVAVKGKGCRINI